MGNRFQLKRFGHLMTWTLYGQKGQLLTKFVSLTAMFFIVLGLTVWTQRDNSEWARQASYHQNTAFCVAMASIACFVFYTLLLANMKTKEKRVTYLSLPASPLEKWLGRVLYVSVVLPLLVPFAFVAGDLLTTLFAQTLGVDYVMEGCVSYTRIWRVMSLSGNPDDVRGVAAILYVTLAGGTAINCLVLLCSTVFRHALLVSIACMVGLAFMLVGVATSDYVDEPGTLSIGQAESLCALLGTVFLLVAFCELWLSYRVFRRMEVVPGRFTNL